MIESLEAYKEMEKMQTNDTLSKKDQVLYNRVKSVLLNMALIEREIIQHKYMGSSVKKDLEVYQSFLKKEWNIKST